MATEAKTRPTTEESLQQIGADTYSGILEMVTELREANEDQSSARADAARQTIDEDPLSVEVRCGWYSPGAAEEHRDPEEFCILLGTGGPATRIIGTLLHGEAESARLQAQDWGTPWTDYRGADEAVLLDYARCFWFGE